MIHRTLRHLGALALLLAALPGQAQQIRLDPLPDAGPAEVEEARPVVPQQPAGPRLHVQGASPESRPATTADVLLPLRALEPQPGRVTSYRMEGDAPQAGFVLFLPQDFDGATLQIATQSSINVLPDRSQIRVFVNGRAIGTATLENFDSVRAVSLPVPPGLLKAGRNLVRIEARQTHRVFCGADASFSLWTDIALDQSGVRLGSQSFDTNPLGFLAAVAAQAARGQALRVHGTGSADRAATVAPVIAQVEVAFGGTPPRVSFEDYYSVGTTPPALARVAELPPGTSPPDGYEFRSGGDGAIVMAVDPTAYERLAEVLAEAVPQNGTEQGLPDLPPGRYVTFGELGFDGLQGHGRYIREGAEFRLPWDWLLLASQRAELALNYRFDTGLPEGALLLVKVNGTTVQLLPLDDPETAGQTLPMLPIRFRASLLQPGVNRVDFEALVPGDPPDQACEPRANPVFEVLDSTQIFVPDSPLMSRPGLGRTLAHLRQEGLAISENAKQTLPAGLLLQLAAVFRGHQGTERAPSGLDPQLTLATPADLGLIEGPLADRYSADLLHALTRVSAPAVATAPVAAWDRVNEGNWLSALLRLDRIAALPDRLREGVTSMWRGDEPDLPEWLADRSAQALLFQPDMSRPDRVWLVVGPRAMPETIVESLAATHRHIDGPMGQVSVLTGEGIWDSWVSPDQPLQLHEPLTLANARAVAGNYATTRPQDYVLVLITITLCSAFVAMLIAILMRRRRP
ncbi:MAG: cellulose biosynthesis cyclic di-GMP-binding regulatory protein BcsB [Salipiger marinus]|uniref:cellulose biosynthesis cyclic di-GMP-binding regulatory protein BcsB n=1 Tax=Salipiger marinus TaxID=555512 RepID=UPI004057D1DC